MLMEDTNLLSMWPQWSLYIVMGSNRILFGFFGICKDTNVLLNGGEDNFVV